RRLERRAALLPRPLPACLAGEAVRRLERRAALLPRPLPACLAGEPGRPLLAPSEPRTSFTCQASGQGSRASRDQAGLAAELVHLPDKPAGVLASHLGGYTLPFEIIPYAGVCLNFRGRPK